VEDNPFDSLWLGEAERPVHALRTAVPESHGPQYLALGPGQQMIQNLANRHGGKDDSRALPELRAEILDRPGVVPIARRRIEEAGLGERVTARVGDIRDEEHGSGYDLLLLSAICHMNSPEECLAMFRKAFEGLSPSGRLVIQDFILTPDKTGPRTGALFALNLLVGTRAGSSYSVEECEDWLRSVGFEEVQQIRLPGPTDLVMARRP